MFEPEMVAFLESGCSAIIGTVSDDGEPHAGRAWGLDVLPSESDRPGGGSDATAGSTVRVLIDADDELTVHHLIDLGPVAITAANVPTLRSVQLKGRYLGIEDADEAETETKQPAGKPRSPQRQETKGANATSVPASPLQVPASAEKSEDKPADKGGAEVVRLDRFRKK